MRHSRFWALFILLVASGAGINWWERAGEARIARRPLREFPAQIGEWRRRGADTRFDPVTESVLRADDYVLRDYVRPDGRAANFYVGYYATQRTGATYHSPLNCLPGSGWTMTKPDTIQITPRGADRPFEANRYIIQNGTDKQLLIYWYQGRGRAVANEYWNKIYTVVDSARRRRSDGAMVRLLVPVGRSEAEALATATELAAQITPELNDFVPR